ncbi:hypothetical protein QVD17_05368 [Tagetes erecta]|uniref:Uncharacterized protein n=1 Tax=Tagetes erecta TaxID=13708 RepID=A0AAD8PAH0_TARER|nr:hypothetical protein QVD17_05368 [Tagetes erecta]
MSSMLYKILLLQNLCFISYLNNHHMQGLVAYPGMLEMCLSGMSFVKKKCRFNYLRESILLYGTCLQKLTTF